MSDARFGSWSAAESPVTIEYSLVVIEEIRHEVAEGFQKLSRGGMEVGGLLYGARDGRTVRILAMRPIACEHARGPAFLLSDSDRKMLKDQLERGEEDPRLKDLICLGWFISHTRSEIMLSEPDLETFGKYFSAPWQVTLVIRPGRGGSMRAGFFVREHDGTVRSDSSYLEFNFPDRLAGVLDRSARADRPSAARGHTVYFRESAATPAHSEPPQAVAPMAMAGPQLLPPPAPRPKWPWLVVWGVAVLVLLFGLRYFVLTPAAEPLELSTVERNGKLQIEWNRNAKPVASAVRGSLMVTDGTAHQTLPLTAQDLERGVFPYQRTSDDVEVRMTVENSNGERNESKPATFLGPAPAMAVNDDKLKQLQQERDDLQAEVDRLKGKNAGQAERIHQLELNLKVLQSRLGIQ